MHKAPKLRQLTSGFSLIELLVAMVIALVVLTGVVNSFLASKEAFRYNDELAFIQESARFAMSKLSADVREAGSFGCHDDSPDNPSSRNNYRANNLISALSNPAANADLYKPYGAQGYDASTGYPSFVTAGHTVVAGSDAMIIRHGDANNAMAVQSHSGSTFTLNTAIVNANQNYKAGTIMVYADAQCRYQAIFESRGPAPPTGTISHATGSGSPGNFTTALQGQLFKAPSYYIGDYANSGTECSGTCAWEVLGASYLAGSKVMPLSSNTYFVAPSTIDPNMNSLWVSSLNNGGGITTQELVLGVDDMRLFYGVDTDATADGLPNRYVTANVIGTHDAAKPGTTYNYLVWNRVASVRVQLLMRSHNKLSSDTSQSFRWDDSAADVIKNDGYLRQMVSFTIQLRNPFRG